MEEINQLNIDEIDHKIIKIMMENPEITHEEIAKLVSRSQPAVGARILKLKKKQLIATQVGINFRTAGLILGIVQFTGRNPSKLKRYLRNISQLVHVFKLSGRSNFMVFIPGKSFKEIDEIVDLFLRPHPDISDISLNYLSESFNDLILPYHLVLESTSTPVTSPLLEVKNPSEFPLQYTVKGRLR